MVATSIDPLFHRAVLFDMDGVLTNTARLHSAAWKGLFDQYLAERSPTPSEDHRPFTDDDYRHHVDGKSRVDGVLDFLHSRGIGLPRGDVGDEAGEETAHGLGKLKDEHFRRVLDEQGAEVFADAVSLVESLHQHHVATAVISASRNCSRVLEQAGIGHLFGVRVDGVVAAELELPGKPDPALFLEAARRLGVPPARAAVVEDAEAGVAAARAGGFALVLGLDRAGLPRRLADAGADVVVSSLDEVTIAAPGQRRLSEIPDGLVHWNEISSRLRGRRPVLLLDFDGTLAPIRKDPAQVSLSVRTRAAVQELVQRCPVAVISGRDLSDVRGRVRVEGVWCAGSHGFELAGPGDDPIAQEAGEAALPALDVAEQRLSAELAPVAGALVDRKRFALAAHYRNVSPADVDRVVSAARQICSELPGLRVTHGRKVVELLPDIDWNKGRALRWLLERAGLTGPDLAPVFAGDDYTDEDALREVHEDGLGIVVLSVEHGDRLTWAHCSVDGADRLIELLSRIAPPPGAP
ncbi:trehalose 6-phosphatase [Saccharopolyspora kobensis]|uniref:Trehalose 6-phosphate phosphatase n=1 Tax=Saccharopolyspora kobensis TaxID=146035 RepID=A0A1H5V7H5_9PSEU|nr:trehalose-phosphatase [Saccharopolyspora kobensis]SEF83154.1 trehalose 6-phosphatase [Saccharopolyspora kobensis]SFC64363.1 trehalose 6-phosphatase [Saccharopolyspora kobensis]